MSISEVKSKIGDFSKDTRINLPKVFTEDGSKDLSLQQIFSIALSVAYALRNKTLVDAIKADGSDHLDDMHIQAAKSSASIMAMNNIYYRFVHLVGDTEYGRMPAGLRMQVIMNSGIDKKTFELMSLAVSSINGCGMCMESHAKTLENEGVSKIAVQSAVRISAVLSAADQALLINDLD